MYLHLFDIFDANTQFIPMQDQISTPVYQNDK